MVQTPLAHLIEKLFTHSILSKLLGILFLLSLSGFSSVAYATTSTSIPHPTRPLCMPGFLPIFNESKGYAECVCRRQIIEDVYNKITNTLTPVIGKKGSHMLIPMETVDTITYKHKYDSSSWHDERTSAYKKCSEIDMQCRPIPKDHTSGKYQYNRLLSQTEAAHKVSMEVIYIVPPKMRGIHTQLLLPKPPLCEGDKIWRPRRGGFNGGDCISPGKGAEFFTRTFNDTSKNKTCQYTSQRCIENPSRIGHCCPERQYRYYGLGHEFDNECICSSASEKKVGGKCVPMCPSGQKYTGAGECCSGSVTITFRSAKGTEYWPSCEEDEVTVYPSGSKLRKSSDVSSDKVQRISRSYSHVHSNRIRTYRDNGVRLLLWDGTPCKKGTAGCVRRKTCYKKSSCNRICPSGPFGEIRMRVNGTCGTCESGEEFVTDKCVPVCPAGETRDENGDCRTPCPAGEIWSGTYSKCIPLCPSAPGEPAKSYDADLDMCTYDCPTGTTKTADGLNCQCTSGGYIFSNTRTNVSNTSICKCPDDTAKPSNGICPTSVTCSDGKANSGICCPNGKKMPVGGRCCPNGKAITSSGSCGGDGIGNPPPIDLAFPRTFNVHGDLSVRSSYSIGRTDRPNYECYAYKTNAQNEEVRQRQSSASCLSQDTCTRDSKNRCVCKTLKNGKYVDITSRNNGASIGEDNRFNGNSTYCEYAGLDPLRIEGSDEEFKTTGTATQRFSREFQDVTTVTIPFVPPH